MRPIVEFNPFYLHAEELSRRLDDVSRALRTVEAIDFRENPDLPTLSLWVNGRLTALLDPSDSWTTMSLDHEHPLRLRWERHRPPLVLKHQLRRGANYPPGTISAGYPSDLALDGAPPDLATRPRPISVLARMRAQGDYSYRSRLWMRQRSRIVRQAESLAPPPRVRTGLVAPEVYRGELWDTEVGFDWRGFGTLTRRIVEYIRAGVVPICHRFGEE